MTGSICLSQDISINNTAVHTANGKANNTIDT